MVEGKTGEGEMGVEVWVMVGGRTRHLTLDEYEDLMASRTCWRGSGAGGYYTHSVQDYCEVCFPLPSARILEKPSWLQRLLDKLA